MNYLDKIKSREQLIDLLKSNSNYPGKIGYTSGSFDLLHAGHVNYLAKAKEVCDLLIVGLNSDASVKSYKSEIRPIVPEDQRAKVLAALESVDFIFIFDEDNNNVNIDLLKPDLYIKAGDYSKDKLSSAKIIEAYGGEVKLIPVIEEEASTTGIVNSVLEKYSANIHSYDKVEIEPGKAVILDRDGTINEHVEYLFEPEKFKLLPGAAEGIKAFQDKGYKVVIITNQPGLDFGYFTWEDLFKVNKEMLKQLSKHGVLIDKIYFSPYTKAASSECRKPGIALIKRAEKELNLDLSQSIVIGDSTSDILMGQRAGCKTVLVKTGNAGKDGLNQVEADIESQDLLEAAERA